MDRGFAYGDGFFETMFCIDGNVPLFDRHYDRIIRSLVLLGMEVNPELEEQHLRKNIHQQWPQGSFRIRLSIYREKGFGYLPSNNNSAIKWQSNTYTHNDRYTGILSMLELQDTETLKAQLLKLTARKSGLSTFRNHADPNKLSALKSLSALHYVMASKEAIEQGWDDAVLLDDKGNVSESTHSNLYVMIGSCIYTPHLNSGCVAGVARDFLLQHPNLNIREMDAIKPDLLMNEHALVFSSNALRGLSRLELVFNPE